MGADQQERFAVLADEVHRARTEEARRRVQRHRVLVALLVLAAATGLLVAVTVRSSPGQGEAAVGTTVTTADPAPHAARSPAAASTTTALRRQPPPAGETPDPAAALVLVDRQRGLPPGWAPAGLVTPTLAFAATDEPEKMLLRPVAAAAIDRLAAAAARAGAPVIGISAYRSEQDQREVHDRYVTQEGAAAAATFSAAPGHSEHQTGLAIDLAGPDGSCATEPCFAASPQAAWLAAHAAEFGFVVRYPPGKEPVTTYTAEPWHLRYVGIGPATEMQREGLTLDEYLGAA